MGFAQLHCHHAGGSMLDSVVTSEELAKRASELGHKYLVATDHGRCSAWYDNQKACNKYGIKPIFGIEQYIVQDDELVYMNQAGKRVRSPNNHIILLAKNKTGMKNISHLLYDSMADDSHFYYNNHNTFSEVFKYSEGIVCGTACMMSPFSNALKKGNENLAINLFMMFLNHFKDDFYVEVQLNELTREIDKLEFGQKSTNDFLISLAEKHGVPIVITGDVHYLDKEDYRIQDISLAMREKRSIENPGFSLEARTLFYQDVNDYKFFNNRFGYNYSEAKIDEWCNNAEIIAKKCTSSDAEISERMRMIFPSLTPNDENLMETLTKQNLMKIFNVDDYSKVPAEYSERLDYELELLTRKGFGSYCMVLYDIFKYCNENEILTGFGRGSGAGSLALYLLGITKINPIEHGLLFSRFINEQRCVNAVYDYFG